MPAQLVTMAEQEERKGEEPTQTPERIHTQLNYSIYTLDTRDEGSPRMSMVDNQDDAATATQ